MEKRQRIALLGIAAAIAVAAVVIALVAGGGDDDGGTAETSGAQQAQTQQQDDQADGRPAEEQRPEKPEPEATSIRVEDGEPVGGVEKVKAKKGDTVRIDVTSDGPEEMHLHVYDITEQLEPGKPTRLRFKADVEGVIELELHGSGNQIAEIAIEP